MADTIASWQHDGMEYHLMEGIWTHQQATDLCDSKSMKLISVQSTNITGAAFGVRSSNPGCYVEAARKTSL